MSVPGAASSTTPAPKLEEESSSSRRLVLATVTMLSETKAAGYSAKLSSFLVLLPAEAT